VYLKNWKKNPERKPLIVCGLVGLSKNEEYCKVKMMKGLAKNIYHN